MRRKKWFKPKLTIFTRSRNDELVLEICKSGSGGGSNPIGQDNNCRVNMPPCTACGTAGS